MMKDGTKWLLNKADHTAPDYVGAPVSSWLFGKVCDVLHINTLVPAVSAQGRCHDLSFRSNHVHVGHFHRFFLKHVHIFLKNLVPTSDGSFMSSILKFSSRPMVVYDFKQLSKSSQGAPHTGAD